MNAVKRIPNDVFFSQIDEILADGQSVTINVTGRSMNPTFKHEKDKIVLSPCDKTAVVPGDVVLFDRGDQICVHRIIRRKDNKLIIRGDGNAKTALEPVTTDAVIAKVTAGTMFGFRKFTVDDPVWKFQTNLVMKHFGLVSKYNACMRVLRTYILSMLMMTVLLYLSFFNPAKTPMPSADISDKLVHSLMYFALSMTIWFDWYRVHRACRRYTKKALLICVVMPVVMGGLIELGQTYLTTFRSGEWLDFAANSLGVAVAFVISSIIMLMYKRKI